MKYYVQREKITSGAVRSPEESIGEGLFADIGSTIVFLLVSEADRDAFDALPPRSRKKVLVHNILTDQYLYVKRSSCGAGCYCGAAIVQGN